LAAARIEKAMGRWRRRSRVIYFWRRALPVLMLAIIAAVMAMILGNTIFGARRLSEQTPEVRMIGPRFLGRGKDGRPYTVTAVDAVRDGQHPELVSLNHPHLVLQSLDASPPTVVDALKGLYNETTHVLVLDRQVMLDDGKSDLFRSEHAVVYTDQGAVQGASPVNAVGPVGTTTADRYAVKNKGKDITFEGHVKSHLVNK
jgi:lipopolysaccharide export system protein LptC